MRTQSTSASQSLQTFSFAYQDDLSNKFLRSQPLSMVAPDGVKKVYAYQLGTWNGSAFTPDGGIGSTGTASRVAVITGSNNSSAGTALSALDGYDFPTVYLVDGKSTKELTIRDSRALVVRTEQHIWQASAWQVVSSTDFTYDFAGRLTSRVASNGGTYTAAYDGGLKTSETDEAGVTTTYTYDAAGRVATTVRSSATSGSVTISALTTSYTYDAAGHVTQEQVASTQTYPITTSHTFDDAGRVTSDTNPGGYGNLSYSYNATSRTKTVTRADSSTTITTNYIDGRLFSTTGTSVVPEYHTYGVETTTGISGQRWHKVNVGTSSSARWNTSWTDWLSREIKTERPGFTGQSNSVAESFYETGTGHLIKTTKTGYSPTLYQYNAMGQVSRSGLDYDNNGTLDLASSDRITDTDTYFESYSSAWWVRTDAKSYPKLGLSTVTVSTTSRQRLTGLGTSNANGIRQAETQSIDIEGNVTSQTVDVNRTNKTSVATTTLGATTMTENSLNGFSISVTGFDGLTTAKGYDAYLRPNTIKDSRNNTTTTTYLDGTKLVSTVANQAGNTSTTTYDSTGRVSTQSDPLGKVTRSAYTARGQLFRQWGNGAMPVEYGYDTTYGDKITMKTYRGGTGWDGTSWPASPGTGDWTRWAYDEPSGLLQYKYDAKNLDTSGNPITSPTPKKVAQSYNVRGQTATRTLARGVTTTYSYDGATGELTGQTYSDSTPAVSYTYGRSGQIETIADTTGTRDLAYDSAKPWRLTAEAESDFYGDRVVTRLYDDSTPGFHGRVRGFQLGSAVGSNSDLEQTFGFTTLARFETVTSNRLNNSAPSRTFRYSYVSNSRLLSSLSIDGSHPFSITRSYESTRDLVTGIETKWGATSRTNFAYTYDARGQRQDVVQTGDAYADYDDASNTGTHRIFTYDERGQLTADVAYLGGTRTSQTSPLPGRRYEFGYDTAGNRQWSNRTGNSTLRDDYSTNNLNQYVTRENNAVVASGTAALGPNDVGAMADGNTAVAVAGGTGGTPVRASRQGHYWSAELTVNNNANPASPNPWRGNLTIFTAKRGTSGSPDVYRTDARLAEIGAALQTFTHDDDGNLLSDGIVDYTWDAENRLVRMETTSLAQTWNFPHREITFRYDYLHRRVEKRVVDVTANQEISCRRFFYDGWNVIAEYLAPGGSTCGALVRSYTWGLDIALSQTNAGGVGALLQIADHPTGKTYLPAYDGNGNVVALFDAGASSSASALAAVYEYSPFGEPVRSQILDSTMADNPFRFSTKWTDVETGLVYYGHRYYDPKNGRFINRDPIEESGGLNLYGFCRNDSVNLWDCLGMDPPDATITTGIVGGPQYTMVWGNGPNGPGYYNPDTDSVTTIAGASQVASGGVFDEDGVEMGGGECLFGTRVTPTAQGKKIIWQRIRTQPMRSLRWNTQKCGQPCRRQKMRQTQTLN